MKIRHIGIVCLDLNVSLKFWTKYFNFKISKNLKEDGTAIDNMFGYKNTKIITIKLKHRSGLILELLKIEKPRLKKRNNLTINNGITHFSITIKNLDKFYSKYKNKINFNCPPQLSMDGNVKVLYAKTPEKCYIELVEEL